jgi:hypothetical protein
MEAISAGFPGVQCHIIGNSDAYEDIVWDAGNPVPSKQTLDEWIAANPVVPESDKRITVLAFRNRFTVNEKIATELAAIDNPAAAANVRQFAAAIRVMLRDTESANFIDLSRADTRAGVQMLEQYGIIGVGRASQIMDTPPSALEKPIP